MHVSLLLLLVPTLLAALARAGQYRVESNIVGGAFDSAFDYEAIKDPTHGRVNYVDRKTAQRLGLAYTTDTSIVLRADHTTHLKPGGVGRNSVRVGSKKAYRTHVAVFDIRHMPEGCGTWPAIWETKGSNWPDGGEVDILEGVNDIGPNQVTLHTSPGCTMPAKRDMNGTSLVNDCGSRPGNNTGCGVSMPGTRSYGPEFNKNGGGWYAMERTTSFFKMWFWARDDGSVPDEVRHGAAQVSTTTWGTPSAYFPNKQCDLNAKFQENNIIINLTFCGDWANSAYPKSKCPGSCVEYVNKNPDAFANAYFDFAAIRVYT